MAKEVYWKYPATREAVVKICVGKGKTISMPNGFLKLNLDDAEDKKTNELLTAYSKSGAVCAKRLRKTTADAESKIPSGAVASGSGAGSNESDEQSDPHPSATSVGPRPTAN